MALCPKTNQPEQDVVYTPEFLAEDIIKHFNPKGKCLDPCRGDGAFYQFMPKGSDWCEIQEGVDFFEYDKKVDWIITNPPWSILRQFYEHSIKIGAKNIVFLYNFNALMTKARLRLVYQNGYGIKEIYAVPTPKENWPQAGFQLGAVHVAKGYEGPVNLTFAKGTM